MQNGTAPEINTDRRKERRRSGVRAAAAAACGLLLLFLLYYAIYSVISEVKGFYWSKDVAAAIKANDISKLTDLLNRCRREAPYLVGTSRFKSWERQLLQMIGREKYQQKIFKQRLAALQHKLKNSSVNNTAWQEELAEIAVYAATARELDELRSLEAQCRALEKLRETRAAEKAAGEIARLEKEITYLEQLGNKKQWAELAKRQEFLSREIAAAAVRYPAIPEIGKRAMQLNNRLETVSGKLRKLKALEQEERDSYRKLFDIASGKELAESIRLFLKRHPESSHGVGLKKALSDLVMVQSSRFGELDLIIAEMAKNNQAANAHFRNQLEKIVAGELEFGTFELLIRTYDNRIVRFRTLNRTFFKLQPDGRRTVSFTALDGKLVKGVFSADNHGSVEYNNNISKGMIVNGSAEGVLPVSFSQQVLLKLRERLQNCKEEEFALFLYFVQQQITQGRFHLLPPEVKTELQHAIAETEAILQASALQFIFTGEIMRICRLNKPVFAGSVVLDEKNNVNFTPALAAFANKNTATLWLISPSGKNGFYEFGKLKDQRVIQADKKLLNKHELYIVLMPEHGADYAVLLKKWHNSARSNLLKIPPLPEFLRQMQIFR